MRASILFSAAALAFAAGAAHAADAESSRSMGLGTIMVTPDVVDPDSLYAKLGGADGVNIIVDQFYSRSMIDNRLREVLSNAGMDVGRQKELFKQLLVAKATDHEEAAAELSAEYAEAFRENPMSHSQFNAGIENLYLAMEDANIPYYVQNNVMHVVFPLKDQVTD